MAQLQSVRGPTSGDPSVHPNGIINTAGFYGANTSSRALLPKGASHDTTTYGATARVPVILQNSASGGATTSTTIDFDGIPYATGAAANGVFIIMGNIATDVTGSVNFCGVYASNSDGPNRAWTLLNGTGVSASSVGDNGSGKLRVTINTAGSNATRLVKAWAMGGLFTL